MRQTAANICLVIGFAFFVVFASTAIGQSVAASAHNECHDGCPLARCSVAPISRERGWLRNRSRFRGDRSTDLIAPEAPNAASNDSSASTAIWQSLGPAAVVSPNFGLVAGRVSSIAVDPSDPTGNRVYLGTTGGGVWVSQNAGTAGSVVFTPLTDNPAAFNAVRYRIHQHWSGLGPARRYWRDSGWNRRSQRCAGLLLRRRGTAIAGWRQYVDGDVSYR